MITVVNQGEADRDVYKLLNLPMAGNQWRGVSYEPALGPIDWTQLRPDGIKFTLNALTGEGCHLLGFGGQTNKLDFIIFGGESGDDARPPHPGWGRQTRDQCAAAGTAFMFKQWGEFAPTEAATVKGDVVAWPNGSAEARSANEGGGGGREMRRLGKKAAGRLLDGKIHNEFPRQLR